MLTLAIDPQLFTRFPALSVGGFLVSRLDRASLALTAGDIEGAWRRASLELVRGGITIANVTRAQPIDEWRQAYASCGIDPGTHLPGVERVVRRTLTAGAVATQAPVVSLSCAVSARHVAPLGGYDIDALPAATIMVRAARPDSDWFVPLGARPTDLPLDPDVIVYAAGDTVLSWSFNHRDSRQTCVHRGTVRAAFFSEAVRPPHTAMAVAALYDLRHRLAAGGAQVGPLAFADIAAPAVALDLEDVRRRRSGV
jgi:DNA/RNA-binding domain of Phe-tRNA-synthetase-like protein